MLIRTRNNGNFLPSIFDELLSDVRNTNLDVNYTKPDFNLYETEKEFVIEAALPGYEKNDFGIEVENSVLNITCDKEVKTEEQNKKYYYREFVYGKFRKSYSLPENVNSDKISATYENGILVVSIPKEKEAKISRQIKIG